ncbi:MULTISPECIES: 5-demethoxyubiquinol-8 5-hydroxylase UbiM [unclassified Modicisalibacter]|uniref:5-demethoxyubiquinol-8 5-hydroxylase UbiM n=1 Tax=unclassified Modicisalibacter TaxID=2679913 RepID=UPI001CCCFB3A
MTQAMKDVAIVGAGPAGLCLAVELAALGLTVAVIDRAPRAALAEPADDGREIALTHASRRRLEAAGIWSRIAEAHVAPIRAAQLYDGDATRPLTLAEVDATAVHPLGQFVANRHLRRAAFEAAQADSRIELIAGTGVTALETATDSRVLLREDGERLAARLVVAADGRLSAMRRQAGVPAQLEDTGRHVLVCRMAHEHAHDQVTWSWFGYRRALALLPLSGRTSSVVMTVTPDEAEWLHSLDAGAFSAAVSDFYRHRLGAMQRVGDLHGYPLWIGYAERLHAERLALIGDAAIGLHPATAHGFNVGLASVERLVGEIARGQRQGRDIGDADVLAAYDRAHRQATRPLWLASRAVVGLYNDTRPPARLMRRAALGLARRVTPLRWGLEHYLLSDSRRATSPRP